MSYKMNTYGAIAELNYAMRTRHTRFAMFASFALHAMNICQARQA